MRWRTLSRAHSTGSAVFLGAIRFGVAGILSSSTLPLRALAYAGIGVTPDGGSTFSLPRMVGLARRMLNDPAEAEDVAQESFIRLWKSLSQIDPKRSVRAYLLTITHHIAIDHLRKRQAFPFSFLRGNDTNEDFAEQLPGELPTPEEVAILSEDRTWLTHALTTLSPKDQAILYLHHDEGLSFREIGEITGSSQDTIKSRYRRALQHLRTLEH